MTELSQKGCVPCRGGVRPLSGGEATALQKQVPDWIATEGGRRIERTFRFNNFKQAFDFVRAVAELAEAEQHHPDVSFGWGTATISLQTKTIRGLHENDFIVAAKIDRLPSGPRASRAPPFGAISET